MTADLLKHKVIKEDANSDHSDQNNSDQKQ